MFYVKANLNAFYLKKNFLMHKNTAFKRFFSTF
jgi:hypothetical protein